MQLPYAPVEFTTSGAVARTEQFDAAVALAKGVGRASPPTHVLCLCHGWNNTVQDAERFYTVLADRIAAQQRAPGVRPVVVGLLWPSVQWADEGGTIAGGALAAVDAATRLADRIDATVEDPAAAAALRAQVPLLDHSPGARAAFVEALRRSVLPSPDAVADDDPMPSPLLHGDVEELFRQVEQGYLGVLARSPQLLAHAGARPVGGPGGAAGFGDGFLSPLVLARFLLNMGTYYRMKERAGDVGRNGVARLLRRLATEAGGASVSLVGHSFGARVISAAAADGAPAHALCLLQGAFSQFAFDDATGPLGTVGAFRRAVRGGAVGGPIVVTHSQKDLAVRFAYAIASRIAQQVASGLGDRDDPYGGIGANGAVGLPAVEVREGTLGPVGTTYRFAEARVHNLAGDAVISGHGAVDGPEVANAVRQAAFG
ncbi:hypothetical protein [Pseudonocardia lacus]|uniref:hypothetical protein n=1 Tax=Pseudonocardia lacus TaxID=2835865 RepID=UPI001BDC0900|nr:hypothetical protein [Pseudonocardia lacus]